MPQMNDDAKVESSVSDTYVFTIRLAARFIRLVYVDDASFYGRGKYDRRRRDPIRRKFVDDLLEMLDRRDSDFHDERIAAGTAMTFENFIRLFGDLDDVTVIDTADAHPDKRDDREPDFRRIDLGAVSGDDPRVLELSNTLDNRRCRKPDASAKFGVTDPRILLQLFKDFSIDFVDCHNRLRSLR